uniref:Transmembrane protein n=1 Tax=Chromera velia CCMP2878 TaxID=1169474 RepID=A0A0G4HKU5_9ALVE|eukprot:Cvel_7267.t1-p1 / transcript=Cvel_7267.t1 / gene=Cvel_7267 / organism=Chromera_velia_CCMP2878 / gene_product=hypothetical protein / transcript_product=hypothetical protein / location=Cvel_scaffold375:79918-80649(+) / protein_length=244 / sequence_SO=supercontig / SO=protein_coding / is_pseudo=false
MSLWVYGLQLCCEVPIFVTLLLLSVGVSQSFRAHSPALVALELFTMLTAFVGLLVTVGSLLVHKADQKLVYVLRRSSLQLLRLSRNLTRRLTASGKGGTVEKAPPVVCKEGMDQEGGSCGLEGGRADGFEGGEGHDNNKEVDSADLGEAAAAEQTQAALHGDGEPLPRNRTLNPPLVVCTAAGAQAETQHDTVRAEVPHLRNPVVVPPQPAADVEECGSDFIPSELESGPKRPSVPLRFFPGVR